MADDEVVVKRDTKGNITVYIGDRCITVPGTEEKEEERGEDPVIDIQRVSSGDAFGDLEKLDWKRERSGVRTTRAPDGSRLARRRID